jgi:hypothetical protein
MGALKQQMIRFSFNYNEVDKKKGDGAGLPKQRPNITDLVNQVKIFFNSTDEEAIEFIFGATNDKMAWMSQEEPK